MMLAEMLADLLVEMPEDTLAEKLADPKVHCK
jgi:hypothetical protein